VTALVQYVAMAGVLIVAGFAVVAILDFAFREDIWRGGRR